MKIYYDSYTYLILINKNMSLKKFLHKSGVKRGQALQLFIRIYNNIFSELIDVRKEYNEYYSFEYSTFEHFLYKKFNLNPKDINKIQLLLKKNNNLILYRKDEYSYGDYSLEYFTFSKTMSDRILNILLLN